MPDLDWRILAIIGVVLLWLVLNLWVFPKHGIST